MQQVKEYRQSSAPVNPRNNQRHYCTVRVGSYGMRIRGSLTTVIAWLQLAKAERSPA